MQRGFRHAAIIALFSAGAAWPAPDEAPAPGAPPDPFLERFRAAQQRSDWADAAAAMKDALASHAGNASYHNLYAYALRSGSNPPLDVVFRHYHEALRIDPAHRGAHAYIGEAYLMAGNPAKAREHLAALDRLCFFGCDEYTMLKQAIAQFEQRQAKR